MNSHARREFLKLAGYGAADTLTAVAPQISNQVRAQEAAGGTPSAFDVKAFVEARWIRGVAGGKLT